MTSMNQASCISFLLCHFLLVNCSPLASDRGTFKSNISIPALFVFGDSWVDSGNGKYMGNPNPSSAYGVDFKVDNQSRASNEKTMADFIGKNKNTDKPYNLDRILWYENSIMHYSHAFFSFFFFFSEFSVFFEFYGVFHRIPYSTQNGILDF